MKLHSNILTADDVHICAAVARKVHGCDIYVDEISEGGSRKAARRITFYAHSKNGKRARNGRQGRAATWSDYGYLIAELYRRDPDAIFDYYANVDDFVSKCTEDAWRRAEYSRGEVVDPGFIALAEMPLEVSV